MVEAGGTYGGLKDEGNQAFKRGDWAAASALYQRAAAAASTDAERAVVAANRSTACLKGGDVGEAVSAAAAATALNPAYSKGHFRAAQALLAKGTRDSSIHTIIDARSAAREATRLNSAAPDAGVARILRECHSALFHKAPLHGPVEISRDSLHGVGMRATRAISPGETLLEDLPVAFSRELQWQAAASDIVSQLEALPAQTLAWVTDLHDPAGDAQTLREQLFCIWDANGHAVGEIDFRMGEFRKAGCAIYTSGSRVNHSCFPNSVQTFCRTTGLIRVRSLVHIPEGEEITITYSPLHLGRAARHKKLRFTCTCPRCEREAAAEGVPGDADAAAELESRYDEISELSLQAERGNDPNMRDRAAERAAQLEEDTRRALGDSSEAAYMACMLRCKLWAERPGARPSFELLHALTQQHMPPNFPILVSTNIYLALHKAAAEEDDAIVLQHINAAFKVHRVAIGGPLGCDAEGDDIDCFWSRYHAELTLLEVDSLERARMLFGSIA